MSRQDTRSVFVDSSAFFATISLRDRNHLIAVRTLLNLTQGGRQLITTNFVVAETHALLLTRLHHQAATQFLQAVDASNIASLRVTEEDETTARGIIYRYADKSFSLVDAMSFAVMTRLDIQEAFTFDRNFAQFGFQIASV